MHKSLIILLLCSFASIFMGACGGTDKPDPSPQKTAEQTAVEQLTGGSSITWATANGGSVSKDGNPVTADFAAFELRLISTATNRTYTTSSNSLFDQNGNWSFAGGNFDKIEFSGSKPAAGREISFSRNGEKLTLTFNIPMPGGRTTALAGAYVFELVKK